MRRALLSFVLLLSACGDPPGPPGICFDPAVHDLGRVAENRARVISLPWRRTGGGSLRVLGVRSDCGCALFEGIPDRPPAGAAGALRLSLRPRTRAGPFRLQVRLYTDAPPPAERVVVEIHGFVQSRFAFAPARLDLGPRSPGVRVERTVEVRWDASEDAAPRPSAGLVGLDGVITVAPPAAAGTLGCLLRLQLDVPRRPGSFEGEALLRRGAVVLGRVPIRGEVDPSAASLPRPSARPGRGPPR